MKDVYLWYTIYRDQDENIGFFFFSAYQLSKDAKGENDLVFNETTINKNGNIHNHRMHIASW